MLCRRLQRLPNAVSITSSIITLLKPLKLGQWSDNHRVTAYNVKRTRTANCKALYRQMALFWRLMLKYQFMHQLPVNESRFVTFQSLISGYWLLEIEFWFHWIKSCGPQIKYSRFKCDKLMLILHHCDVKVPAIKVCLKHMSKLNLR